MDGLDTAAGFMDGLLNFSSDEEDDDEGKTRLPLPAPPSPSPAPKMDRSAPELIEELEWLSNKDAFPEIETFLPGGFPLLKQQSPVSVLETSHGNARAAIMSYCTSFHIPVKARSKGRRRRTYPTVPDSDQCQRVSQEKKERPTHLKTASARKCQHCQSEKTPQWRAGPNGPKTLCNACGVRYKSGRLVPEYRPASSPTFSSKVHSNSHRKIMEMRRLREAETG